MASMAHSMPLPGPRSPQVKSRGAWSTGVGSRGAAAAGGVAAPWGITTTFDASTSKPVTSRVRAVSVITTTMSARSQTRSSTYRWLAVGVLTTVWATTIIGTTTPSSVSRISTPSGPS